MEKTMTRRRICWIVKIILRCVKRKFVCAVSANNIGHPTLLRTYIAPTSSPACKIWQATRATTAAPTFFKHISIGNRGSEVRCIDAGLGCNNPTRVLIDEAKVLFKNQTIECVLSIGTGQKKFISLPEPTIFQKVFPTRIIEVLRRLATDSDRIAYEVERSFSERLGVYFRFNVNQGMQEIILEEWKKLSDVRAHTEQYLKQPRIARELESIVDILVRSQSTALTQNSLRNSDFLNTTGTRTSLPNADPLNTTGMIIFLPIPGSTNPTEAEVPALPSLVTVTATEVEITLPSTSTLQMMHDLADTYHDQKKYSETEKLLNETIEGRKKNTDTWSRGSQNVGKHAFTWIVIR
ncbi:Similar to Calcium-independent phospholipase A2-gamma; acc. no. Q9NP80 [Pyronema omphalodes CBS 100304]|uniref:Similar to Calcium-independent phospholipase A2-gamma acc. no. Q9NP80 n=1 Tax=Pyronema omphalodes (strain CBS 100304) TaxID=1076935 RepID=U4LL98_PYROM|nr:Similar to Calcium-independent phospholipase A2-gamma; acc. no. Q9NP80 [Pyronema omphalodes CBS 100304]